MSKLTCPCGFLEHNPVRDAWLDMAEAVWYKRGGPGENVHCPMCGAPCGFAEDGTPKVGPTYAELRADVLRLQLEKEAQ